MSKIPTLISGVPNYNDPDFRGAQNYNDLDFRGVKNIMILIEFRGDKIIMILTSRVPKFE